MPNLTQRIKHISYTILAMMCLTNSPAWGDAFDITPFVGVRVGGELDDIDSNNQSVDLEVEDGDPSFGFIFAVPVYQELRVEFLYSHQETKLKANSGFLTATSDFSDIDIDYYHIGASWEWAMSTIHPFFSIGIGATQFDPDEPLLDDDIRFSYSLGGGVKLFLQKNIALHLGGRFFSTYIDSHDRNDCHSSNNNNTVCFDHEEDEYLDQFEAMLGLTFRY
jgi:opacity protein-like surface antigen